MTITRNERTTLPLGRPTPGRRFGYLVAIVVNGGLLWFANRLPEWDWPRFLTDEYGEVLPILSMSLIAGMAINAAFLWFDAGWFKSLGNLITAGVSFAAAITLFRVFPFDFATYAVDWTGVTRVMVLIGIVGTGISIIVESIKLLTWPFRIS